MTHYSLIGRSKNDKRVVFDPIVSHTITHFNDTPGLEELVKELIPSQVLKGDRLLYDVDMDKVVGRTDGVETDETDEIVYAKRLNRDTYTRFTMSREPQPSSLVALAFERIDPTTYELKSAWIGEAESPPFPDDEEATPESLPYWNSHALVLGSQKIQPGTETTTCPW